MPGMSFDPNQYSYGGKPNTTPANAAPANNKLYRPDVGSYLTDAEYAQHQQNLPIEALKAQTGVTTGAQKDVMGYGNELQQSQAQQAAKISQAQLAAQTGAQRGLASQQAGLAQAGAGQAEQLAEKQATAEASLQASAEQRRLGQLPQALGALGISGVGDPGGQALPSQVDQASISAGEDSARNAAFAHAKDTAGETGRSAMSALQNVMGARGLTGSPYAVGQAGGVIGAGAQQLGDVNREQLIQALNASRQRASEAYQGQITQRGQDISTRGQNLSLVPSLLGLMTARY